MTGKDLKVPMEIALTLTQCNLGRMEGFDITSTAIQTAFFFFGSFFNVD